MGRSPRRLCRTSHIAKSGRLPGARPMVTAGGTARTVRRGSSQRCSCGTTATFRPAAQPPTDARWKTPRCLDINALESFTFLEEARRRGVSISHLCEFTDNTSAEYAADRGKPSSARLTELVTRRYDALYEMGISSACERVASVDNDIADGLSRGGKMLADALRVASAA